MEMTKILKAPKKKGKCQQGNTTFTRSDEDSPRIGHNVNEREKIQIGWTGNIEISTASNMEGSSIETFSVSHDI